jgi:hypothetical protein
MAPRDLKVFVRLFIPRDAGIDNAFVVHHPDKIVIRANQSFADQFRQRSLYLYLVIGIHELEQLIPADRVIEYFEVKQHP